MCPHSNGSDLLAVVSVSELQLRTKVQKFHITRFSFVS